MGVMTCAHHQMSWGCSNQWRQKWTGHL